MLHTLSTLSRLTEGRFFASGGQWLASHREGPVSDPYQPIFVLVKVALGQVY